MISLGHHADNPLSPSSCMRSAHEAAGYTHGPMPRSPTPLNALPGHLVRRLHQVSVAIFSEELQALGLTPLQFAVLSEVSRHPGLDQRSLARRVALDASTTGGVVDRLEARGALRRQLSPEDRRVRLLHLTDAGQELLQQATSPVQQVQDRLLAPLTAAQHQQLMGLLHTLLQGHQDAAADD